MTEPEEQPEKDYTTVLGKAPTALQARFAEWLMGEEVGYDPKSAKSKEEAFREGVRLGVAHRMNYQASTHNREATAAEKAARQQSQGEEEAPAPAPAKKAAPAKAAPAKKAPAKKAAPAATPATAPPANRPAAKRAPARRAPVAASTAVETATDAPF